LVISYWLLVVGKKESAIYGGAQLYSWAVFTDNEYLVTGTRYSASHEAYNNLSRSAFFLSRKRRGEAMISRSLIAQGAYRYLESYIRARLK
jgi:hypothetical protein